MKRGTALPTFSARERGSRAAEGLIVAMKRLNGCGAKEPQSKWFRVRELKTG